MKLNRLLGLLLIVVLVSSFALPLASAQELDAEFEFEGTTLNYPSDWFIDTSTGILMGPPSNEIAITFLNSEQARAFFGLDESIEAQDLATVAADIQAIYSFYQFEPAQDVTINGAAALKLPFSDGNTVNGYHLIYTINEGKAVAEVISYSANPEALTTFEPIVSQIAATFQSGNVVAESGSSAPADDGATGAQQDDSLFVYDGYSVTLPDGWSAEGDIGIFAQPEFAEIDVTILGPEQAFEFFALPGSIRGLPFEEIASQIQAAQSFNVFGELEDTFVGALPAKKLPFTDESGFIAGYHLIFLGGDGESVAQVTNFSGSQELLSQFENIVADLASTHFPAVLPDTVAGSESDATTDTSSETAPPADTTDTITQTSDIIDTFTASDGLTIEIPRNWFASEGDDGSVVVAVLDFTYTATIRSGESIVSYYPAADINGDLASLLAAARAELESGGASFGEVETLQIQGGEALRQSFELFGSFVGSSVLVFNLSDGTPVMIEVLNVGGAEVTEAQRQAVLTVAESVTFDAEAAAQAAEAAANTADLSAFELAQPLLPSQMPEGLVILSSGLSFARPSGLDFTDEGEVYSSVSLASADFLQSVIVDDLGDEYANFSQINQFLSFTAPILIGMTNPDVDTDPATFNYEDYFETITFDDGRTAITYEGAEEGVLALAMWIVEVSPGRFVWVQGQAFGFTDNTADDFLADLRTIAETLRFDASVLP